MLAEIQQLKTTVERFDVIMMKTVADLKHSSRSQKNNKNRNVIREKKTEDKKQKKKKK